MIEPSSIQKVSHEALRVSPFRRIRCGDPPREEFCKRIVEGKLPTSLTIRFTRRQRMVYYLFWTAYSTKVDSRDFEKFFGVLHRA